MYTVDQTLGSHSHKVIHTRMKSPVHVHGTESEVEILNSFKTSIGNGWFATDPQGRIQTSDSGPRTGTFH